MQEGRKPRNAPGKDAVKRATSDGIAKLNARSRPIGERVWRPFLLIGGNLWDGSRNRQHSRSDERHAHLSGSGSPHI